MTSPLEAPTAAPPASPSGRPHLARLIAAAATVGPLRMALAYPCNDTSLLAAAQAARIGLIEAILLGPAKRIAELAREAGVDIGAMQLVDTGEDPGAAARAAVALCREGHAGGVMKGSLHTDELMAAVLDAERGLRTGRRVSHAFVFDVPCYPKPLVMGDCVVNIGPQLMDKRDITQNCIDLARALGIAAPRVAVLSAVETVNPAIRGTVDAAALSKMAERGQITGAAAVEGPLAFDVAVSLEAARTKGLATPAPERPDILIVPDLEAGNLLYKQLVCLAGADCAGMVLGTSAPVVLTSRADSTLCRIASCALAVVKERGGRPFAAP